MFFFQIIAQAETTSPSAIAEIVAQFGVLGILAWFLYHTTSTVIPGINRENAESVKAVNEKHASSVNSIVTDHKATILDLADRFDRNLREERDARRIEISEERKLRQMELAELASAMREVKCEAKPPPARQ